MGAIPRSLTTAVRDIAVLLVIAFPLCFALDAWATHIGNVDWWRSSLAEVADVNQRLVALGATPDLLVSPPAAPSLAWDHVARTAAGWVTRLSLWLAACWIATRARAGLRTVWVPAAAAIAVVVARSVVALVAGAPSGAFPRYPELWPGPDAPLTFAEDGSITVSAWHPGWAYPPLVAALLLTASRLGARAGRLPDDAASRRLAPVLPVGVAVAAVVVGLPVVGAAAGAVAVQLHLARAEGSPATGAAVVETLTLLLPVVAVALLSGTGPLGTAVGGLATLSAALAPLSLPSWFPGSSDDLLVVLAAAILAVGVAMLLWRPAALWGGEILAATRPPDGAAVPPPWEALSPPPGPAPDALPTRAAPDSSGDG